MGFMILVYEIYYIHNGIYIYIYIYIYICSNVKSSNVKSKLMKTRCRNVFKTYI